MKTIICSVFDRATQAYGRPFFVNHPAQAVRSFSDEVNNPESEISKHSEDYELYEHGFYEDETGSFHTQTPARLARATDLKKV